MFFGDGWWRSADARRQEAGGKVAREGKALPQYRQRGRSITLLHQKPITTCFYMLDAGVAIESYHWKMLERVKFVQSTDEYAVNCAETLVTHLNCLACFFMHFKWDVHRFSCITSRGVFLGPQDWEWESYFQHYKISLCPGKSGVCGVSREQCRSGSHTNHYVSNTDGLSNDPHSILFSTCTIFCQLSA